MQQSTIKSEQIIETKTIESLYTNLLSSNILIFDNIVVNPIVKQSFVFKEISFLNVALPTKFYAAYDPCTNFIYINMTRIKGLSFFSEIVNHEIQHFVDFNDLMKNNSFEDSIELFKDPIYEQRANSAQK